jgi:signal transduction histidine kinase
MTPRLAVAQNDVLKSAPVASAAAAGPSSPVPSVVAASPVVARGWIAAILRVPLLWKLAGATLLIVVGVVGVTVTFTSLSGGGEELVLVVLAVLTGTLAVHLVLVYLALRPLAELERLAERVLAGDLAARSQPSALADRNVARLGRALNMLLDALIAERERMRRLAEITIRTQEEERAFLASELHESTAQQLTALILGLSTAARDSRDPTLRVRLEEIRRVAGTMLDDLRELSQSVQPRVLYDLGPVAAIELLARRIEERHGLTVTVVTDGVPVVSDETAAVLYHVAREALENIVCHAAARTALIVLAGRPDVVTMAISDDGRGFEVAAADSLLGTGIFSMRERVALLGGHCDIMSALGEGTRIHATIPLRNSRDS